MRINKYISKSGIASRREADQIIAEGRVKINGEVVYDMSLQVVDEHWSSCGDADMERQRISAVAPI